jgi:hypothetical protein
MVAVIDTTENLMQVLNYNEKKVQHNKAVLIHAGNFLKQKEHLSFYDKKESFEHLNELNSRSRVNMLHVSVNFHPSEKITAEQMKDISEKYMEGIGLEDQPFLVYQHLDSGHPHFHILTNLIRSDGSRLRTNNLGRNESRKTCEKIEREFGLLKSKHHGQGQSYELKPIDVKKLQYGKSELKKSIQNVLSHVLKEYKFGSLPELNAILNQYNVSADRGAPDSRIYANRGLMYKVLDENGAAIGVPLKASSFYFKPTLSNLGKKFEQGKELRKPQLPSIKTRIDWALMGQPEGIEQLRDELQKEGIDLVIRQNKQGIVYGFTYIDYKTKTVLNGSELGKNYSAKGVLERMGIPQITTDQSHQVNKPKPPGEEARQSDGEPSQNTQDSDQNRPIEEDITQQFLSDLMKTEDIYIQTPYELRKPKKRRRGH